MKYYKIDEYKYIDLQKIIFIEKATYPELHIKNNPKDAYIIKLYTDPKQYFELKFDSEKEIQHAFNIIKNEWILAI